MGAKFLRLGFLGLAAMCAVLAGRPQPVLAERAIVTDQGPLKGISASGEQEYLGIPYAAPPVGDLRWKPPQPPARFRGLFHATQFGNACSQPSDPTLPNISEDCLTLNVYVPDVDPPPHGFPVMVWIHGGSLVTGAGFLYDPTPIVQMGNLIVVTINYRLGLLGFFAHPAIDAEGHLNANYGLMDQQFALSWVKRNIGAFGGNSERVTIFGESAGGQSVYANLASPTAAGLFQRAISESGAGAEFQDYFDPFFTVDLKTAESNGSAVAPAGTAMAVSVGCSDQTADCLRAVPASNLVQVEPGTAFPIVDGVLLTQTPNSAFKSGSFNRVPVISGSNHDESRLFVAFQYDLAGNPLTDAGYPSAVADFFHQPVSSQLVQAALNEYPLSNYPPPEGYSVSAPLALGALESDIVFVCTARNADLLLSPYTLTYTYEFNDETAPPFLPSAELSFPQGDSHFIELEYLFDLSAFGITPAFNSAQQQLSDTMIGYWTQFAKTGSPNFEGAPHWPAYTGSDGQFESLVAPNPTIESDASFDTDHKCSSFWNTF